MANLRSMIDGKTLMSGAGSPLVTQVGKTAEAKEAYNREVSKLNLHTIPTKAALDYLTIEHGLHDPSNPLGGVQDNMMQPNGPNDPNAQQTDLPNTGQMRRPMPGRGQTNVQQPGMGMNKGNKLATPAGPGGKTQQTPSSRDSMMPGQKKAMGGGKSKTANKGGRAISVKVQAGGPGSGRHAIGHSFYSKPTTHEIGNTLQKLGYHSDNNKQWSHPDGSRANVDNPRGRMNINVHMNAPLEHHNALNKLAGRPKWSEAGAKAISKSKF